MNFSRIISGVAHPMLMPLISVFVIFHSGTYLDFTPHQLVRVIYMIVAISTLLLPISILPLLKNLKIISDIGIVKSQERFIPLILSLIFYFLGYYMLLKLPITRIIPNLQLVVIISIFIVTLISFKWKISLHMVGIGGFLGMVIAFTILYSSSLKLVFMVGVIFAGLIAYSRLKLNLHTPSQVYVGFIIGLVTICSCLLLLQ